MKNLVLPGLGRLTVADHAVASETDLDGNFFVRSEDVYHRRPRAEVNLHMPSCFRVDTLLISAFHLTGCFGVFVRDES